jgi:hypothetical protein
LHIKQQHQLFVKGRTRAPVRERETTDDEVAIEELVTDAVDSTDELRDTTLLVRSELAGAVLVRIELVMSVDDKIELDATLDTVE